MDYFDHLELRAGLDVLWLARSVAVPAHVRKHRLRPGDTRVQRVLSLREDPVALRRFCGRSLNHLQVGRLTDAQLASAVQSELESGRLCGLLFTLGDAHTAQARVESARQNAPPPPLPKKKPVVPQMAAAGALAGQRAVIKPVAVAKPVAPAAPVPGRGQAALGAVSAIPVARPAKLDVAGMELEDRFREVVSRAIDKTPGEAGRALQELLAPENLLLMAGIAGGMVIAYGFGVGEAATVALLAWAYYEGGKAAVAAIGDIVVFLTLTYRAKDEGDLEDASWALSRAAVALVQVGLAVLLHKLATRKAGGNKPAPVERRKAPANPAPQQRAPRVADEAAATGPPKDNRSKASASAFVKVPSSTAELNKLVKGGTITVDEARDIAKASDFKDASGGWIYPPKDGFLSSTNTVLKPGAKMDRFGGYVDEVGEFKDRGSFFGDAGADYSGRALPPGTDAKPMRAYEVVRELPVEKGPATPWFGEGGGNTQYKTAMSVDELIDAGYIVPVK